MHGQLKCTRIVGFQPNYSTYTVEMYYMYIIVNVTEYYSGAQHIARRIPSKMC